jgi:hypothetical protein
MFHKQRHEYISCASQAMGSCTYMCVHACIYVFICKLYVSMHIYAQTLVLTCLGICHAHATRMHTRTTRRHKNRVKTEAWKAEGQTIHLLSHTSFRGHKQQYRSQIESERNYMYAAVAQT